MNGSPPIRTAAYAAIWSSRNGEGAATTARALLRVRSVHDDYGLHRSLAHLQPRTRRFLSILRMHRSGRSKRAYATYWVMLLRGPNEREGATAAVGDPRERTSACCRRALQTGCSGFGQIMPRARLTHRVGEHARRAGPVARQPCNQCLLSGTGVASTVSVEDYVHDALHFVELDRVQGVEHLDMRVALPLDRDS